MKINIFGKNIPSITLRIVRYLGIAVVFTLALAGLLYQTARAQNSTPPTDDQVNAVAHQLYCPVCESTPLDVCPTDACKDWRQQIRVMLSQGKSQAEILQYFEDQYGARVLAEPPKQGFYWLIYLLPPVVILAGAFLLYRALKEWTKPNTASTTAGSGQSETPADNYVARLEEELKKRK
jgi:cytochrome c-type biogenesis protein CcmH